MYAYSSHCRFNKKRIVAAVTVPVKEISEFQARFSDFTLTLPKCRSVRAIDGDSKNKLILVNELTEEITKFAKGRKYPVDKEYEL